MFYNLGAWFFDAYSEDGSDWVNAKGVLSLPWGHSSFYWFAMHVHSS